MVGSNSISVSYDAPQITRVFPSVVGDQGGFSITVEGSNFGDFSYTYTSVSFEGVAAQGVFVVSSTTIVLRTPPFCLSTQPIRNSSILVSVNGISVSANFTFLFLPVYLGTPFPIQGINPIRIAQVNTFSVNVQCFDVCASTRPNMCDRLNIFIINSFGKIVQNASFTANLSAPSTSRTFSSFPLNLSIGTFHANVVIAPDYAIPSMPLVVDVFPDFALMLNSASNISLLLPPSLVVSAFSFGVSFQQISSSLATATAISVSCPSWSLRVVFYNSTKSFALQSGSSRRLLQTDSSCASVCSVALAVDPTQSTASLYVNGVPSQNMTFNSSNSSGLGLTIGGSGFSGIPISASFAPDLSAQNMMASGQQPNEYVWPLTDINGASVPVSQPSNTSCCPAAPSGSILGNPAIVPTTPLSFKAVLSSVVPSSGLISGGSIVTVSGAGFVNSYLLRCKFYFVFSNSSSTSQVTSASFVDPFTVTCLSSRQSTYGIAYVQVSNDNTVWSDPTIAVTFTYYPSVLSLNSVNSNASSCIVNGAASFVSFWFLLNPNSSTFSPFSNATLITAPSLQVYVGINGGTASIQINSTACGFSGGFSSISLNQWHFFSFNCQNPSSPSFLLDSTVCSNSSVQMFPPDLSSSNRSISFSGINGGVLLSSVVVKSAMSSFEWPLFSGGNTSYEESRIGSCQMQFSSDYSWILMNSPSILPSLYTPTPVVLSYLSDTADLSGDFFAPFTSSLGCVCFKDNGVAAATRYLTVQGVYVNPSTLRCSLPLGQSGKYYVFASNDLVAFRRTTCFDLINCNAAALSVNFTTVLFAPALPLITNGSLSTNVTCSSACSKIAITFWLYLNASSANNLASTHLIDNSAVRVCSVPGFSNRSFYVSNNSCSASTSQPTTAAAVDMWHFFALEVDPSTNGASLSVDYQAIQTCSINALFTQSVSIVFQASLPQVFASISLLSYSNTTGSILNRDAISRLRMTSGAIYSSASLLLAYWPGHELTDNKTIIATVGSASTPAVLVLDGSFTYADVADPFQNPLISLATTTPDTIPNNVQSVVTITGRDFSLSPYLVCIFSSKQCNVNTSLFPLNLNFAACAFPAIYASRTSVSCIVPSLFSQAMINVSVTNSLPGLSSSSSALKVMESVIQVGSFGSVSASTLNANSTTNSSGRTFTFWLYIAQSVQALPEYRFFSVQIVCSNVSNATFSLTLQSGGLLKAYYPTASLPLTTLPSQPTGLSIGWHFMAVTLQPNGLFLYVDNSDFTFAPSNFSCSNSSCVSVSLESTPGNFTQASGGSLIFSQFRIFDGLF